MEFWYNFTRMLALTYRTLFIPSLHVDGKENVISGPKIVVANHNFASDVFIIPSIIKDRLHFLVEEDLLTLPLFGRLLEWSDQIPVAAGKGKEALQDAYDRLKKGNTVVIFPEGQLNHGKSVRRARSGAIHLALESGYPVLPLGIYTPPHFTRIISKENFGRETVGGWQFGGSSFVSIGNAWNLAQDIRTWKENSSYRMLKKAADDLMVRMDIMLQQAKDLASRWGLQPQGSQENKTD